MNILANFLKSRGWGAPQQYLADMDNDFLRLWASVSSKTLISAERAWALVEAVRYVCRAGIPGDFVECGVWKGGVCLLMSHILAAEEASAEEARLKRKIWMYDTFTGMVSPGSEDRIAWSGESLGNRKPEGWWAADLSHLEETLLSSPCPKDTFKIIAGRVEDTLPKQKPDSIAILRLDTDWYESTKLELETLYPRLTRGGVLIIDDYGHFTGAKKAVDEYFAGQAILLHRSDYTGRVLVKY